MREVGATRPGGCTVLGPVGVIITTYFWPQKKQHLNYGRRSISRPQFLGPLFQKLFGIPAVFMFS